MSDQVEIRAEAEAVDVLTTNLTSAELSEFSREHNVTGYSGLTKRKKAENIVAQAPEATVAYLEADDICVPTEALREDLEGVSTLAEAQQRASSEKLASRLGDLEDALAEAPDEYEVTDLEFAEGRLGWTQVRIEAPDVHWSNEGELGDTVVSITLGPRGGLKIGRQRLQFSRYETDHAEGRGWSGVVDAVRRAE